MVCMTSDPACRPQFSLHDFYGYIESKMGKNTLDPKKNAIPTQLNCYKSHMLSPSASQGGHTTQDLPSHDEQQYGIRIIIIYKHNHVCTHWIELTS